jgi:hypothetical protein
MKRGRRGRTPVRDTHFPATPAPKQNQSAPFSVGGLAVLALRTTSSYYIAIQSRSAQVLTAPNAKAVIPNFGLTDNELAGNKSALGILFYNLIKEYLEEMFNYEELIGDVMQPRVDPDWFLELPEAQELLRLSQRGLFSVSYLGCKHSGLTARLSYP